MKLIHCADLHLGSAMSSRLPADKARTRKGELRFALRSLVDYARENDISAILLSGDGFDSDHPAKKDKDFFYSLVKNNPDINFFYLRGNHDRESTYDQTLPNLKTFSRQWSSYRYGDVTIWGLELSGENEMTLYDSLPARREGKNIVLLHGQTADSPGPDRICLSRLRGKHIDYLALGHVHSYSFGRLDDRGTWCYPGCLEGRGYDETGDKGFVVVDTDHPDAPQFVPHAIRTVRVCTVDISESGDLYEATRLVEAALPECPRDLLRLELTGQTAWDTAELPRELAPMLQGRYFHTSVKNRTTRRFDAASYLDSLSLAGEFVRQVMALGLSQEAQQKVIDLGLRALNGGEVALWD